MNIIKGLLVFALVVSGGAGSAFAQNEDVFVVPRVPVQAQADTAREAKNIAQSQGRRRAMDILLRRLTVEDDWVYLPKLRSGVEADAGPSPDGKAPIAITTETLLALESGFVVYGEKSSSKTYRALITYRFKPEEVRRLLRASRIPYSEAQTRTALVLPVLQTDSAVYLWEPNNPWMAAWKARPYTHELTPMTAPLGDLEDSARITARQALALNEARLKALAEHYSVSQVIVAHARLRQQEGKDQVSVRLINGYRESGALAPNDELGELLEQETTPAAARTPANNFAADVGDVLGQAFLSEASGNFPMLAERAIELSIAKYSKGWKARTLIDYGAEAILDSTAFFGSIQEWAKIRSALVETPLVGSVQVSALSKRGAEMRMRVFGDPSRLVTALESQGLTLWTETGERWFVATPSTAQQYRGRRFLRERDRRRGLFGDADSYGDAARPIPATEVLEPEAAPKISN
ncbi:MAG: DUF2066 domain-containing protein [Pseudomonadota bacterium]